jgi:ADP-heptose:LPS heptosyltransferase
VKKKIVVIIGGRGIGDLIYHLPLLKSLYKTYGEKIYIISNKINQSKEVFKNEVFYKKIIEFDNYRFGIFKTIKNIFIFKKKINDLKPKYIFLTSNTKRLLIPVLLSNAEKKYIIGNKNFIFNKDKSSQNLTFSQKILKFTKDLKLSKKVFSFSLNNQNFKINKKSKKKKSLW